METKTSTSEMIGMIEQGVKDVLTSERFTEFLKFSAQFHNYSLSNVILILIQKPDASYVASMASGFSRLAQARRPSPTRTGTTRSSPRSTSVP